MERRGRATAPVTAAPREDAPAPSTSIGMFMPSTIPELRGRQNLGTFLKRFRTWACLSRCDSALDSKTVVNTSVTPRTELERLHQYSLVENSLKTWHALTKALEKEKEIMEMVINIGSISEAWSALTKIAAEIQEAAYDRSIREFGSLEIGVSEPVTEYFASVHVVLKKLTRHHVATPARETITRPYPWNSGFIHQTHSYPVSPLLRLVGRPPSETSLSKGVLPLITAANGPNGSISFTQTFYRILVTVAILGYI